ncbi:MAG: hypothetical protein ACMUHY_07380 [Thermoplasmatota archaeon]
MRTGPPRSSEPREEILISLSKTHDDKRILCVDISPDDELAAIGLINGTVLIYETDTYTIESVLSPGYWVYDIEWCPDESRGLIALSTGMNWDFNDGKVKVYSTSTWRLIEEVDYNIQIFSISWNHDGSLLSVAAGGSVDTYDTTDWTIDRSVDLAGNITMGVKWHPEDELLAVGKYSYELGTDGGSVDIIDPGDDYSVQAALGPFSYNPNILRWNTRDDVLGIANLSGGIWDTQTMTEKFRLGKGGDIWIRDMEWVNGGGGFFIANKSKVEYLDPSDLEERMSIDLSEYVLGISLASNNSVLIAAAHDTLYVLSIPELNLTDSQGPDDSDEDGVLDDDDAFPDDPAASMDIDLDGHPDEWNPGRSQEDSTTGLKLDMFPFDPAASIDSDGDGHPDEWNPGMSEEDSTTGLRLDSFPTDPGEWADSDDDSVGDNTDGFPHDPAASIDSDGDGHPDEWNPGMSEEDSTTGLELDEFPLDGAEWSDRDMDGRGDNGDAFPDDPLEWSDTDEDGVGNNADSFPTDPAASMDTDGDGRPDSWNPGMSAEDSTTGLVIDRYPLDPMNEGDGSDRNSILSSPWAYVPIILFTICVFLLLSAVMVTRWKRTFDVHLASEEDMIRRYRESILKGTDDAEFDVSDEELLEELAVKRKEREISEETYTFIIEKVVGGR